MNNYITPEIGAVGKYTYKSPFDSIGNTQTEFTCKAVRTLTDCLALGEDPYKKYYEPFKISEQDYREDIRNDVAIVALQSSVGNWLYIPNSYLLSYPDVSGVRYVNMVIAANIGAIPETLDLTLLLGDVTDVIQHRLGIVPEVRGVVTSQPALVGDDDHQRMENVRSSAISEGNSLTLQILKLKEQINILTAKNKTLSEYIRDNM